MVGPLGKIAAFFSNGSNSGSLHQCGNNNKELKKAANAAQIALKRRNRRNEWFYGEGGPPPERHASLSMAGSSEDVRAARAKFSRKNPVWSSLRDLRASRRSAVPPDKEGPPLLEELSPQILSLRQEPNLNSRPTSDHNGRLKNDSVKSPNGVGGAPVPTRRNPPRTPNTTPPSSRSVAVPPPPAGPTPEEVAEDVRKRLLPQLRHNAVGFEALGVLVDYLSNSLDAFSTPQLKGELEHMKAEWQRTKLELDAAQAGYQRLEETYQQAEQAQLQAQRAEEEARLEAQKVRQEEQEAQQALEQRHREARQRAQLEQQQALDELRQRLEQELAREVDSLNTRHEGEVAALRQQLDTHADAVSRSLREEYEAELDRVTRRHEETLSAALEAARLEAERSAAERAQEASRREAELQARLDALEAEHDALKEQSRRVMDSMKCDRDPKLQALAASYRELQNEVESLRTVLELRSADLQELRRQNDILRRDADQLPLALHKATTLSGRVEDLQLQLERKASYENKLCKEKALLEESINQETKQKKWLSLHNEELQWKLKQKSELVTVLANMSGITDVSTLSTSMQAAGAATSNGWSGQPPSGMQESFNELRPSKDCKEGRLSPPHSPAVKGVVEKSDSVSWVLEIDSPEIVISRMVRRTGSCRSSTPSTSPAHSRALPPTPLVQSASATAIPSQRHPGPHSAPKQRSVSFRGRSRSISSDSGECLSSGNWSPPTSLAPPPQNVQPASPTPESGRGRTPVCDCSDIEDFSSSKSSSMSCSSEGSELGGKEASEPGCYQAPDVMTTSCGSNSELLLSKQTTLPKDAAGEAMISEEMTEDDANGMNSSCDGSCSEEDSNSSEGGPSPSPSVQNKSAKLKPYLTLPITDSATQSANNTPLDSSWSEDMELLVSLSES